MKHERIIIVKDVKVKIEVELIMPHMNCSNDEPFYWFYGLSYKEKNKKKWLEMSESKKLEIFENKLSIDVLIRETKKDLLKLLAPPKIDLNDYLNN